MSDMLKAYSILYCIILALLLLLSLVAKFLVGAAGHTSSSGVSDYVFIAYCVITFICLVSHINRPSQFFKYLNTVLVGIGAAAAIYIIVEMLFEEEFIFVIFGFGLLFILLCTALIRALLKN